MLRVRQVIKKRIIVTDTGCKSRLALKIRSGVKLTRPRFLIRTRVYKLERHNAPVFLPYKALEQLQEKYK